MYSPNMKLYPESLNFDTVGCSEWLHIRCPTKAKDLNSLECRTEKNVKF